MNQRLGQLMVRNNLLTPEQLKKAVEESKNSGGRLGAQLAKLGYVSETAITEFLSQQYNVPALNITEQQIDPSVMKYVSADIAKKNLVIPISRSGANLILAMADPSNMAVVEDIRFMTGFNIEVVVAPENEIIDAIKANYGAKGLAGKGNISLDSKDYDFGEDDTAGMSDFDDMGADEVVDVDDFDSLVHGAVDQVEVIDTDDDDDIMSGDVDAPIIKLVNGILIKAIKLGVSDIHIEPYEKSFRVRYRLDGVLRKAMGLPLKIKNAITSRVKIMSRLDIAEKRLPQDGRIKLKLGRGREMDFRVSTIPVLYGEKVVLRLLDKSNLQLDMTKLGFEPMALDQFQDAIHQPYGMVLVTGPTGSGKTTTLYSALSELNKESDNIMTAEDPVEFNLAGINQVQMHDDIGLNFAAALRSFLRQDPDIVMVGEIRDFETAEIAIKAALTGHLVLSTLHTNDAPSTVNRLLNMGIEPFLVASSLNAIVAQRLARRICKDCSEPIEVPPQALIDIGVPPDEVSEFQLQKGKGCNVCAGTGYKGRVALYEVMRINDELKELILNGASTTELKREAMRHGMKSLRQAGITKIKEGVTTIEEVLRGSAAD
ncbi:MAG: type IV-A pilus assembly ATPase PilB [Deltaproteobacteria bacterium]|nr:type IV-A pilus assembly ATPase PilB [Candidatus Zymogenaceae bacterium]